MKDHKTLSDEIIKPTEVALFREDYNWIEARAVQKFIKQLKEELVILTKCEKGITEKLDKKIDKLAGDKLVEKK